MSKLGAVDEGPDSSGYLTMGTYNFPSFPPQDFEVCEGAEESTESVETEDETEHGRSQNLENAS